MKTDRLNAFTDGVLAIVITIMVLELKVPRGGTLAALEPALPLFGAYVLTFVMVGIFWNNHHHMLQSVRKVDGRVLWANHFLLFTLTLFPFVIRWIGEAGITSYPVAAYGVVLTLAGIAYILLEAALAGADPDSPVEATTRGHGKEIAAHSRPRCDATCLFPPLAVGRGLRRGRGAVAHPGPSLRAPQGRAQLSRAI